MSTPSTVKRSAGRVFGAVMALAAIVAALVLVVALMASVSSLNPFATKRTEHPDSVVLNKIQDLSTFEAASGRFSTIVDQQTDTKLPGWATGERVVLDAEGDVSATVDLSHLPTDAIQLSSDGTSATIHVPEPVLDAPDSTPTPPAWSPASRASSTGSARPSAARTRWTTRPCTSERPRSSPTPPARATSRPGPGPTPSSSCSRRWPRPASPT